MPHSILVAGLKIIRAQHHNYSGQWGIRLDSLPQTMRAHPAWLKRIFPYSAASVQTVLNHANVPTASDKQRLEHTWPPLCERQALPCVRNDAPTK